MDFEVSLKNAFYKNGTKVLTDTSRVTLLNANGEPLGSASMGILSGEAWLHLNIQRGRTCSSE